MKTIGRIFKSEEELKAAVNKLIMKSQWFQVMPLPDDWWEVQVKFENKELLNSF